jgi:hypothetical protein
MRIIKLYTKTKSDPQFLLLKYVDFTNQQLLVNYPLSSPNRNRLARWYSFNEVSIQWVKTLDFIKE